MSVKSAQRCEDLFPSAGPEATPSFAPLLACAACWMVWESSVCLWGDPRLPGMPMDMKFTNGEMCRVPSSLSSISPMTGWLDEYLQPQIPPGHSSSVDVVLQSKQHLTLAARCGAMRIGNTPQRWAIFESWHVLTIYWSRSKILGQLVEVLTFLGLLMGLTPVAKFSVAMVLLNPGRYVLAYCTPDTASIWLERSEKRNQDGISFFVPDFRFGYGSKTCALDSSWNRRFLWFFWSWTLKFGPALTCRVKPFSARTMELSNFMISPKSHDLWAMLFGAPCLRTRSRVPNDPIFLPISPPMGCPMAMRSSAAAMPCADHAESCGESQPVHGRGTSCTAPKLGRSRLGGRPKKWLWTWGMGSQFVAS